MSFCPISPTTFCCTLVDNHHIDCSNAPYNSPWVVYGCWVQNPAETSLGHFTAAPINSKGAMFRPH